MTVFHLRRLAAADSLDAAALLSRGMRDNPTHVQAFGDGPERRRRALVALFTPFMRRQAQGGLVFGAFIGDELVGVAGLSLPGRCQPALGDKLRALGALARVYGAVRMWRMLWRVYRWTRLWQKQDVKMPRHSHLGPLAVAPGRQGQGIGSALLERLCRELDERELGGYLETDLAANVRLYRRFGFVTVAERSVIEARHRFMARKR